MKPEDVAQYLVLREVRPTAADDLRAIDLFAARRDEMVGAT